MNWFKLSTPLRFVGPYAPGMRQSAVLLRLQLLQPLPEQAAERLQALQVLLSPHLASPWPEATGLPADADAWRQSLALMTQAYGAMLRGAGLPVFETSRILQAQEAQSIVLLPCPAGAQQAAGLALQWLMDCTSTLWQGESPHASEQALPALMAKLKSLAPPGLNTIRFFQAAFDLGIPVQHIGASTYQYGWGARARWFDSSFTDATPTIASNLARDKQACAALLRRAGLPVPDHQRVRNADEAVRVAERLGYPVVVKPSNLDGGIGVHAGLIDAHEVREAFAAARLESKKILVEKHFNGEDHRLQVLNGEVFWAVHRVPGGVLGDGQSNVHTLLDRLNAEPGRGEPGSTALLKRIALDEQALKLLERQGMTADSVPAPGQFVRLRRAANVASGGRPLPVLEVAHPDNLALAVRAAQVLRLDLAGVDLLLPDIRQSWRQTGAAICEVNAQPQLSPHLPAIILQRLVPHQGRIPVLVLAGGPSALRVGLRLGQGLHKAGLKVGLASRSMSFVGEPSQRLNLPSVQACTEALLLDPAVQVLVLCLQEADLLSLGLPIDQCSGLLLLDAPDSAKGLSAPSAQRLQRLCRGPVLCQSAPADWGLHAGAQQSPTETAIRQLARLALLSWRT